MFEKPKILILVLDQSIDVSFNQLASTTNQLVLSEIEKICFGKMSID
jgi:hypothetical protein